MLLFLRAFGMLIFYDIASKLCRFQELHSMVRHWKVRDCSEDNTVGRVCTAVNYACVFYPKRALCLQRSFVTTYLLRKHGIPAQMVLGAQKLPFKAHAWVEVNGRTVNEALNTQTAYAVWERC